MNYWRGATRTKKRRQFSNTPEFPINKKHCSFILVLLKTFFPPLFVENIFEIDTVAKKKYCQTLSLLSPKLSLAKTFPE